VKVRGDGAAFDRAVRKQFGAAAADIEKILTVPAGTSPGPGLAAGEAATWFRLGGDRGAGTPWDRAHAMIAERGALGLAGGADIVAAEPDLEQGWIVDDEPGPRGLRLAAAPSRCSFQDQDDSGGKAKGPGIAWSTGPAYSQLATAAANVADAKQKQIVIAHLDTGYDPKHSANPAHLDLKRQRNFVAGEPANDATDKTPDGFLNNPGHGPGTLGILAGRAVKAPEWASHALSIGGAPFATVVPVRIANSVVRFTTGSMVKGFNYATSIGAHVLTMSMGGLSSDALVDAVNLAYENGVFMVTAAGNHYARRPTPTSIVFPARYHRVLAACGVMADGRAYFGLAGGTMQGNHGPASKMATALGAYTPNVPWPEIGCPDMVDMDGAGTSAATPQIAAAAALWLAEHWATVKDYPPWARVEATRDALFKSAAKTTPKMNAAETKEKIGMGVMRAEEARQRLPATLADLQKRPPAEPSWSWLNLLVGGGVSFGPAETALARQLPMLKLELTQMAQRFAAVEGAMPDPDRPAAAIPVSERNLYLERALEEGDPSKPLRRFLEGLLGARKAVVRAPTPATPVRRRPKLPEPPPRRLRVYSLDPSLAQSNEFFTVNQTTLSLPWDDYENSNGSDERPDPGAMEKNGKPAKGKNADRRLKPGPVGEYLEVIDVDPASNKIYDPVDLNDKTLLAQDGLAPSEGNPKFHQQMVYAVGMQTIGTFERALGRRALWAPQRKPVSGRHVPVPRLRIYPHALRAENAYYSPEKGAVLFGYFQSSEDSRGLVAPGSMVFTCLSSDIIAHEMSHALLDGLHRRFIEASNPDVPAFHEAFADIVAIFQHFTFRNLVRFEISRAKGKLTAASLLGGLAMQFGEGSGRSGPLRNYTDPTKADQSYVETVEAHDRGSILVFAVYDAFLKIVARRTADLIRLATGGTGILGRGALHPDLVERLTDETCKVAAQLLNICIRALDYCPAFDITYGEYLRGLVTADIDAMPIDRLGYRVAIIEAFRNRGILPRDVKTVSEETLTWNTFDGPSDWLAEAVATLDLSWDLSRDRAKILTVNEDNRWTFWRALNRAFKKTPELMKHLGLQERVPRYDETGRKRASRNRGAKTTFEVHSVRPARRIASDGSFRTELVAIIHQRQPIDYDETDPSGGFFWFRGGATLIIDPRRDHEQVRYSIIKNSDSLTRRERQRQHGRAIGLSPLRRLYFGGQSVEPFAVVHNKIGGY
jgi:hypothetical protein